ncbi:MAG: zinc ribbon domain-containing protein [Clostridiales bacterium]|nr:zinc ribbon domain-containing protein [Clostridiales bacterium]
MNEYANQTKSFVTPRNIMRLLALFCIIFVFCPSFLVSCSGQKMNVSVLTAVGGIKAYGQTVAKPHVEMLLCLILPVAIIALLSIKNIRYVASSAVSLGCAAVDFLIYLIFRVVVKKMAEENYCEFKTTVWYILNMLFLIALIVLSILVLVRQLELDANLAVALKGGSLSGAMSHLPRKIQKPGGGSGNEMVVAYCEQCGSPLIYGYKFCKSCGKPVPEGLMEAAEALMREAEAAKKVQDRYCRSCGAKLDADALFCKNCGTRVD